MKVTKLFDTESQAVLDVHCSTTLEESDADLCEQITRRNAGDLRTLTADKGYDKNALRERLRELEIRPLIKHRIFAPRPRSQRPNRRRTLRTAVDDRARDWYREFREIALLCVVYNIKRSVTQ